MEVKLSDIVGKVLKYLDENEEIITDRTEFGYPHTALGDLIEGIAADIAVKTVGDAERSDIDEWEEPDVSVEWTAPGRGEVELPEDFFRLIVFRMSDWDRSVTETMPPDSPQYALRFSDRRNGNRRLAPAVAITEGYRRRKLEFIGSHDPGAYVELAGYVPHPTAGTEGTLLIPRSLVAKVIEATAAKVKEIQA